MSKLFKAPKPIRGGRAAPRSCPCPPRRQTCASAVYLSVGETCPHCRLAPLRLTEDKDVRCPVCGYGTARPYT